MQSLARQALRPNSWRRVSHLSCHRFLSRSSLRWNAQPALESRALLRIRLTRPPIFTARRLIRGTLGTVAVLGGIYYFSPISIEFVDDDEDEDEQSSEQESEEGDSEELAEDDARLLEWSNATFIPLSLPTLSERLYYKGSDPEWQSFIKFSSDMEKHKNVHIRFAIFCRQLLAQAHDFDRVIGRADPNNGRQWLETTFPYGPPRHYEVLGFEWADSYISLTKRPLSQEDYLRLMRFTTPVIAMNALAATQMDAIRSTLAWWRSLLQMPESESPEAPGASSDPLKQIGTTKLNVDEKGSHNTSDPADRNPKTNQSNPTTSGSGPNHKDGKLTTPDISRVDGVTKVPDIPSSKEPTLGRTFMRAFDKNMSRERRRLRPDPQQGSVVISGLVEVRGTKSLVTLDVVTEYDIENDRFEHADIFIRSLRPVSQRPKG